MIVVVLVVGDLLFHIFPGLTYQTSHVFGHDDDDDCGDGDDVDEEDSGDDDCDDDVSFSDFYGLTYQTRLEARLYCRVQRQGG